jgi:primase-polymerase (primpol)-like protein
MNCLLQVLKLSANWVRWQYETDDQGNVKKPPYSWRTGKKAWVTNPAHWCPFANWFAGCGNLGFVLTKECNLVCIDLDNKKNDPALYNLHRRILEDFKDTYIEYSPSGPPCAHIWCFGTFDNTLLKQKGWDHKFDKLGVEFYCERRYMTVTLNPLPGRNIPLTDGTERVERWIAELNRLTGKTAISKPPLPDAPNMPTVVGGWGVSSGELFSVWVPGWRSPLTDSDRQVCRVAANAANGEKFKSLYQGEWEELGYSSQNSADLALCNILSFYTNDDTQVRRIFLNSELGKRRKAVTGDYLWNTIRLSRDRQLPAIKLTSTHGLPIGGA